MSAQPESNAPAYRPPGYCPRCSYPTDIGTCPECGADIPPGKLDTRRFAYRRRRLVKRVAVALTLSALLALGYWIYDAGWWTRPLPTDWLLALADWQHEHILAETARRTHAGQLSHAQLTRLVHSVFRLETPSLKASYPRGYPVVINGSLRAPSQFVGLDVTSRLTRAVVDGDELAMSYVTRTHSRLGPLARLRAIVLDELPAGTHDVVLSYDLKLVGKERALNRGDEPISVVARVPLNIGAAHLDEVVTLRENDELFALTVQSLRPVVTLDFAQRTLQLAFEDEFPLTMHARIGILRPGGHVRYFDHGFGLGLRWGPGVGFQRLPPQLPPVDREAAGSLRRSSASRSVTFGVRSDLGEALATEESVRVVLTYDPQRTRELAFDLGAAALTVGTVILDAEIKGRSPRATFELPPVETDSSKWPWEPQRPAWEDLFRENTPAGGEP